MNKEIFNEAIGHINNVTSFCIVIAPTIHIRCDALFMQKEEFILVRDIEHNNNINIIPYSSILYIHE